MKEIRTEDAVGHVLCHDITEIVVGKTKGPRFKKGHIIKEEDIDVLLNLGKEHLYVWVKDESILHEDEAVMYLRDLCKGEGLVEKGPSEGKIDLFSEYDGLLKIDIEKLSSINSYGNLMIASRHNNMPVKKGDKILGTRIIPLVIEKAYMEKIFEENKGKPVARVLPYKNLRAGLITTGSEVLKGRIEDTFSPVIEAKLKKYGARVVSHEYSGDDKDKIVEYIQAMDKMDLDFIITTGGMSVDPDDKTPGAIKEAAGELVTYGAPVLPGAMFALAYTKSGKAIMGLPGCVMYAKSTIFDLILPRVLAGDRVYKEDIAGLGHGGLCLECEVCTYPECSFGKGV